MGKSHILRWLELQEYGYTDDTIGIKTPTKSDRKAKYKIPMKHIEVVAAIIIHEKKILCVQRGENKFAYISKKYEFPGGKLELGESHSEAIKREIKEELLINIDVIEPFLTNDHNYADFSITMHSLICQSDSKDITLTEHIDYKWLAINEMDALDWAGADVPIVEKIKGVNIERAFT